MEKDIAIIGMAGRFPGADNIRQLYDLLAQGKDSVRNISAERMKRTTLDPGRQYMVCGYLEDIDVFDHRLFNISVGEAETMDPHMRLLLEIAYQTFENAAYAVDDIRGTNTAVFVADAALEYYKLAEEFVPTLAYGNTKAFLAAALSRQFDLRANSLTVDTTCSSSLLAVYLACNELLLGEADMALACGANLYLFPYKESIGLDLDAPDGKSKAFSANANGMSHGEAVACVLLKRLDKALADGDIIHAIIKGAAVNSNAARSASITAPDSQAQADVIRRAWTKAGVHPLDIGFIETHGSGTALGDNIEIGALSLAFNDYTDKKQYCPISTIKSNIGHTRSAAGISGLIKTVLSLKHGILFPNIHFDAPHPQINFERSAVFVNRELRPWITAHATRYAGVSSIGLSGTNCHMVLSEAPAREVQLQASQPGPAYLLPVSAQTYEALVDNVSVLMEHLKEQEAISLQNVSYTLWCGRKHYDCGMAFAAGTTEEAVARMAHWLERDKGEILQLPPFNKLVYIFDEGDGTWEHCRLQYNLYRMLEARGICTNDIIAVNGGRLMVSVIKGELELAAAEKEFLRLVPESTDNLESRVEKWLQRETEKGRVVFIAMGTVSGSLSAEIKRQAMHDRSCRFLELSSEADDELLPLIQQLYEQGAPVNWRKYGRYLNGQRIELPGYRFRKKRCWIRETTFSESAELPETTFKNTPGILQEYWKEVLHVQDILPDDNFFMLGGDSIKATKVVNRINAELGLRLDFEDVFDYPTLRTLSAHIDNVSGTPERVYRIWKDVLKQDRLAYDDNFFDLGGHSLIANQIINRIRKDFNLEISFDDFFRYPTIRGISDYLDSLDAGCPVTQPDIERLPWKEHYETSHAQKRLWILSQSPEGAIAYNQPGLYKIGTPLNIPVLEQAFDALISRHEILRTTFSLQADGLVQTIMRPELSKFKLDYLDFREKAVPEKDAIAYANERAARYFDLSAGPLLDAVVIQTGVTSYVFLLNLHHIITDGWSNGVLVRDLMVFYRSLLEGSAVLLRELNIQYRDYAFWQNEQIRSGAYDVHRQYWLEQFREPAAPLRFPADHTRPPVKAYKGRIAEFTIDEELLTMIKEFARANNATLFMVLLSGLYVLLYRFSGQQDITVGTSHANRDHVDLEDQMGFYVNTLAIRSRFDPGLPFTDLLETVKANTLKAYAHGVYPFDLLVEELRLERDLSRTPLFDIMLTLQNMENHKQYNNRVIQDMQVESIEPDICISKFDLLILASENNNRLDLLFEYDTVLLSEHMIGKIYDGLVSILREAPGNLPVSGLLSATLPASHQEKAIFDDFMKAMQDM